MSGAISNTRKRKPRSVWVKAWPRVVTPLLARASLPAWRSAQGSTTARARRCPTALRPVILRLVTRAPRLVILRPAIRHRGLRRGIPRRVTGLRLVIRHRATARRRATGRHRAMASRRRRLAPPAMGLRRLLRPQAPLRQPLRGAPRAAPVILQMLAFARNAGTKSAPASPLYEPAPPRLVLR